MCGGVLYCPASVGYGAVLVKIGLSLSIHMSLWPSYTLPCHTLELYSGIKRRRQSGGVQLSQGAPVNSGDEDVDTPLERLVPTTSYAVVEFLPRGR